MKKKNAFRVILLLVLAVVFSVTVLFSHADFGDFGGDSDFGDFDDFDIDFDSDGNSVGSLFFFGGGSNGNTLTFLIMAVIVVVIVATTIYNKKYKKGHMKQPMGAQRTQTAELRPMSDYTALDPMFSEALFREKVANLYVQMQEAWTKRDLSSLEPYFTDALFKQSCRQVEAMKASHRINYIDRISVLGMELQGFKQADGMDEIVLLLRTRIVDYSVDESTGNVISGDKTKEKFMTYEWHLQRKTGTVTKTEEELTHVVCPSCGASVDINASAKCEYCDTVLHIANENWAISEIRGISQQTV